MELRPFGRERQKHDLTVTVANSEQRVLDLTTTGPYNNVGLAARFFTRCQAS
jgi:hypothetical protein